MASRPYSCPHCSAFVRFDWTDNCGACGQPLTAPEPAQPVSPAQNGWTPTGYAAPSQPSSGQHWGPPAGPAPMYTNASKTGAGTKIAIVLGVIGAGFVLLVVICVLAVVVLGGADPQKFSSTIEDPAALGTTDTKPDKATTSDARELASQYKLDDAAFDRRWVSLEPGISYASAETLAQPSPCFPDDPQMNAIALALSEYSYNLDDDGLEGGHIAYATQVMASDADAAHQFERVSSSAYEACAMRYVAEKYGNYGSVRGLTIERITRNLPTQHTGYRVKGSVVTSDAQVGTFTQDIVFLTKGHVRIRMVIDDGCNCDLGPIPDKEHVISEAAKRLNSVKQ